MSSREEAQPALLVLSRAIYAKRSDNNFYPGTVETKLPDGSYLVKFTGGTSERVKENEITWLGFWGLPPWIWPRNPIVQPVGPANSELLSGQLRSDSSKDDLSSYVSFRTLFQQSNERTKRGNGPRGADLNPGTITNGCDDSTKSRRQSKGEAILEQYSAHVSPTRISENQKRTSVLRMCCNGSSRQGRDQTDNEVSSTENQVQTPGFTPSPHSITSNNEDTKQFNFDEDETQIIKNHLSKRKRKLSSPEQEECSVREHTSRYETIENRLQNTPPLQEHYPLSPTLPTFNSHRFHNYGHPFGISVHNSSSPPRPASFRLQTRTRRRSENKKCRKVYGIENRDIWCTQCKWKKACTRFAGAEKSDLPDFMYMSEYDGRHYPM